MYTFIAYKENSTDYCKGCRMASYSSDHQVENCLTKEKLIEKWANCLYRNLNLDCNETGYVFWIFKDGVMLFKEGYTTWDGAERYGYNTDEYYAHMEELEAEEAKATAEINAIYETAKEKAKHHDTAVKADAKRKADAEKSLAAVNAKEERRKQFDKLQQEFQA